LLQFCAAHFLPFAPGKWQNTTLHQATEKFEKNSVAKDNDIMRSFTSAKHNLPKANKKTASNYKRRIMKAFIFNSAEIVACG
jgi:hypothetical protein